MDFLCAMGNKGGKSGSLSEPNMESQTSKKRVEWLDDISIRVAECIEATATKEEQPIEVHTWAGVSDTSNDDIHISTYS